MTFPFVVSEQTGPRRSIVLTGRSLPYQGVSWGGTQRLNVNYFPGNPVGVAQVIGGTYKPTTITGKWKDQFLLGGQTGAANTNAPRLFGFPAVSALTSSAIRGGTTFVSAGTVGGAQFASRARVVRDAFELIRRSGQLLRVEWGSLVRYGFLTDTNFDHDREEDIGYEFEFTWIGDTDAQPVVRTRQTLDPLSTTKQFLARAQQLLDALLRALAVADNLVRRVQQSIRRIGSLVTDLAGILERFATLALVPVDIIGNLRQQYTAIVLAVRDLVRTIRSIPPAYQALQAGAGPTTANVEVSFALIIANNAAVLGELAVQQRLEIDALQSDFLLGIYVSPGGVTLRDVATQFYGAPTAWPTIAEFNGLPGSRLPVGTVVRVPRLN